MKIIKRLSLLLIICCIVSLRVTYANHNTKDLSSIDTAKPYVITLVNMLNMEGDFVFPSANNFESYSTNIQPLIISLNEKKGNMKWSFTLKDADRTNGTMMDVPFAKYDFDGTEQYNFEFSLAVKTDYEPAKEGFTYVIKQSDTENTSKETKPFIHYSKDGKAIAALSLEPQAEGLSFIKIDTIENKKASGTFLLVLQSATPGVTMSVTGRFGNIPVR